MKRLYIAAALVLVVVAVSYIKSVRGTTQRREAFENGKAQAAQELTSIQQDVDSLKELLRLQEESFGDSLAQRDGLYREEISRLVGYLDSAIAQPKQKPVTQKKQPAAKPVNKTVPKPVAKTEKPPAQKSESKPEPEVIQQTTEEKPAATETPRKSIQAELSDSDPMDPEDASNESVDPERAEPEPSVEITKPGESVDTHSDLREDVLTYYGKLYEELPKDLTSQERKVALYEISIKTAAEYSITMPQLKEICEHYYLSY